MSLFLLGFPRLADAADGVREINQTCAEQTGCFAGDAVGFPVTISVPGSYRLTSNLAVSNEDTTVISFGAAVANASIDLGGFEIRGPVVCSALPLVCAPASGTGSGVEGSGSMNVGISVKNGSITGMGASGVSLGEQAEVTGLRVGSNRFMGIQVSGGSTVADTAAYRNGSLGILSGAGSTVSANTAHQNGSNGLFAESGCTIVGNTFYDNGDAALPALDDGIECDGRCVVQGNSTSANSGYGLNLGADAAYRDNVVTENATGTVTGSGSANSVGGNYCAGTGTGSVSCP